MAVALKPVKEIRVGSKIDLSILGMAASWSDNVKDTIIYSKNDNFDKNGRIPIPKSYSAPMN